MANPAPKAEQDGLDEPEPSGWRRIPKGAVLKFVMLVVLVVAAALAARWTPLGQYLDREVLKSTLDGLAGVWWSPLLLVGLFLVFCPLGLPATPILMVGGLVFGALYGGIYNFIGTFSSALVGYALARFLGADFFHHLVGPRLGRIERLVERRGFWYLIGMRLLPIPFPIANFGLALAGVSPATFALTSALGLAPSVFLWSWFAASLGQAATGGAEPQKLLLRMVLILVPLTCLIFLPALLQARGRRRRLARLRQERAAR